jgi:fatty acid desaturase
LGRGYPLRVRIPVETADPYRLRITRPGTREGSHPTENGGDSVLWLAVGVVLLVIAIAGGSIVHPVLFALGILALLLFFTGWRGRTVV